MASLPTTYTNLAQPIFAYAKTAPEQNALLYADETISYSALANRIQAVAKTLKALALREGDKIGLLQYNTPGWAVAYFAALSLNMVIVPLNTRLTAPELATILSDSGARFLISSQDFIEPISRFSQTLPLEGILLDEPLPGIDPIIGLDPEPLSKAHEAELSWPTWLEISPLEPDSPKNSPEGVLSNPSLEPISTNTDTLAALIYTSGTTGKPKGVMLSHGNILADATANAIVIEAVNTDRFITISPLFHVFGQTNNLVTALLTGACLVLVPRFSPRRTLEAIERYKVTFMAAVPTMYLMMLSHLRERNFDLSSLRVCHSGAAPMAVDTFHAVEAAFGAPVQEGYGLSEASSIVCSNPMKGQRKPGSVGLPLPGVDVQIRDDNNQILPAGCIGELYINGPIVMLGYYQRLELTAKTLHPDAEGKIWLKSRDMGFKDSDGYIHIVDRTDDLINIGGVKIYPREIEEVLQKHPAVHAVAATGIPSTMHHESIKAFVVPEPNMPCTREILQEFCRPVLADYKIPQTFVFVDALPQGATGKILRRELR